MEGPKETQPVAYQPTLILKGAEVDHQVVTLEAFETSFNLTRIMQYIMAQQLTPNWFKPTPAALEHLLSHEMLGFVLDANVVQATKVELTLAKKPKVNPLIHMPWPDGRVALLEGAERLRAMVDLGHDRFKSFAIPHKLLPLFRVQYLFVGRSGEPKLLKAREVVSLANLTKGKSHESAPSA